ncbi:DUF3489 domain-containing protein [Mesorhizobium sp. 10J20-29]
MTQIAEHNDSATASGRSGRPTNDPVPSRRLARSSKSAPRSGKMKQARPGPSKADVILRKLGSPKGASIQMLVEATGWQAHSVRGFLSGTVKKKLGHTVDSEVGKDGTRRYRIAKPAVGE